MNKYKQALLEQYKSAEGINSTLDGSKTYMLDLVEWIKRRQIIANNYIELLSSLNLPFEYRDCAEVGKGQFDTIVKEFGTTIITPHIEGLDDLDQNRIIPGTFEVVEGKPILTPSDGSDRLRISSNLIKTYMTQNPFSIENIANWEDLHNSHHARIILGVYGSIYDKDIATKIAMLQELHDKLDEYSQETYEENGDEYFYVVSSKPKVKKMQKFKTK